MLVGSQSTLLREVPDLVEYPSVVAGHIPVEFLQLPEEVLTTTMIHHQHYFPVVDEEGRLKPAFLAVTNMQVERPELIARNSERVLTARLRDARFFWDEDRKVALGSRADGLSTLLYHKKLGNYREKTDRVAVLAGWIAGDAFGRPDAAAGAEQAGRLCKADLTTDMVRELTELQGTMGGIYGREEGLPEDIWKAIYYHYLPVGVDAEAAPSREQLGTAAVTWAALSLADKLDSVVGMFCAGERPTGSRDPLGLRRQAQGLVKILVDLPALTGLEEPLPLGRLLAQAALPFKGYGDSADPLFSFVADRLAYLLEQRGFELRRIRAVMHAGIEATVPLEALRKLEALSQMAGSEALLGVATLLKRVKNISKGVAAPASPVDAATLTEPAERGLAAALAAAAPVIRGAAARGDYGDAFTGIASLQPVVAKFFDDVLVMAEDEQVRAARLGLVASLRDLILEIADISEIVTE